MTEQQQSSPINLFRVSAPTQSTGDPLTGASSSSVPADKTFSKKLSLAKEGGAKPHAIVSEKSGARELAAADSPQTGSVKLPTEKAPAAVNHRATPLPKIDGKPSGQTLDTVFAASIESAAVKDVNINTSQLENLSSNTEHTDTENSIDVLVPTSSSSAVSITPEFVEVVAAKGESTGEVSIVSLINGTTVDSGSDRQASSEISIAAGSDVQSANDSDTSVAAVTPLVKVPVEKASTRPDADALKAVQSITSDQTKNKSLNASASNSQDAARIGSSQATAEKLTNQPMTDQQTPLSLAAGKPETAGEQTSAQPSKTDVSLTALKSPIAQMVGNSMSASQLQALQRAPAGNDVDDGPGASKEFPTGTVLPLRPSNVVQNADELAAKHVRQAELQEIAERDSVAEARKLELQNLQSNTVQMRRLASLQFQNQIASGAILSTDSGGTSAQSADNMFHSLQGGIVTAPVQQRTDAGGLQPLNAPITMSILQTDADKAMTGNIRWMVNEGVKNAVVNVSPSGMGPISVTVGMEKDQMQVSIVAMQGSTREALDSMIPRLREQLAAQGHDSVKVDVSDGRSAQSDRGYGQQFSGEQTGFDQEHAATDREEAGGRNGGIKGEETAINSGRTLPITVDSKNRSNYDIYV